MTKEEAIKQLEDLKEVAYGCDPYITALDVAITALSDKTTLEKVRREVWDMRAENVTGDVDREKLILRSLKRRVFAIIDKHEKGKG